MICLDTNYLIRGLMTATEEAGRITRWLEQKEPISIPAVAWYEFLCGPVSDEEIQLAKVVLTAGVLAFFEDEATEAARLFNAVKRKRAMRVDAMIAGTAIVARARLATRNRADFKPFTAHGLTLA